MLARLQSWVSRLRFACVRRRLDEETRRELEMHRELLEERYIQSGLTADEARRTAHRQLGNVTLVREELYQMNAIRWIEDLVRDVRYAVRTCVRTPMFTALGVLTLALGIGANTAVFSVANAVLVKPLGYPEPDRLVTLRTTAGHRVPSGDLVEQVSGPNVEDWLAQSTSFDSMAYCARRQMSIMVGETALYAVATGVSSDFLGVLGVSPVHGPGFTERAANAPPRREALVSHAFAQRHFNDPATAAGRTIRISTFAVEIAGVMPRRFAFPPGTDIWYPLPRHTNRGQQNFLAVGRLKQAATVEQAQAELDTIAGRLERQYPEANRTKGVLVTRLHDQTVGDVRLMLHLLLAVVAVVLLIACANVATMLLARGSARAQETSLRAALGASRWRIVCQTLTEGLLQGTVAAVAGLLLAWAGTQALVALAPGDVPRLDEVAVDRTVLAFTLGVAIAASLLVALAPAVQAWHVERERNAQQGTGRTLGGSETP